MSRVLSFIAKGKTFALPIECVREILALRNVADLPTQAPTLRGGLKVRGGVIPLFDFRTLIGSPRLMGEREEVAQLLHQREQEHVEWLDALMKSVKEGVEFRSATDPKACTFGKWYYSFQAPDPSVERTLRAVEAPHTELHGVANKALTLCRGGQQEDAIKLVEITRSTTLSRLMRLFGDLRTTLVHDIRELAIICATSTGSQIALAVDAVENIRDLQREGFKVREGLDSTPMVSKIWSSDAQTVLEIDTKRIDALLYQQEIKFEPVAAA